MQMVVQFTAPWRDILMVVLGDCVNKVKHVSRRWLNDTRFERLLVDKDAENNKKATNMTVNIFRN